MSRNDDSGDYIFTMYITTKDGKRIYRKNGKPFKILVRNKK